MRILVIAPRLNLHAVGEALTAAKLLNEMAKLADITLLSFETRRGPPLAEQMPDINVITFPEPAPLLGGERFSSMLKLSTFVFNREVRRWLAQNTTPFDLAHQILPRAPRYPSVLRKAGIPYVIGSLGGALPSPKAFAEEGQGASWFTRLRAVDGLRFAYDPWLRASYTRADLVLGVAPYMQDVLSAVPLKRFEPFLGIGIDDLPDEVDRTGTPGQLRMIHVGRAVRTKGLRDTIRAMGHLKDTPGITLTVIGDGEEIAPCKAEATQLGLADRVEFLGRLPRDEIEAHYRASDALCFPSFRESMGAVLYEAMRWGLPTITVATGGPDYIVDDTSGLKVPLSTPEQMPKDLAQAIKRLADDPEMRAQMGRAARARLAAEATWPVKAQRMIDLYQSVLETRGGG